VDLALLLDDQCSRLPEEYQVSATGPSGQIVVIEQDRSQKRWKYISDIFTWMKVFSRYVAAITSCETTTGHRSSGPPAFNLAIVPRSWASVAIMTQNLDNGLQLGAYSNGEISTLPFMDCLSAQQRHSVPHSVNSPPLNLSQWKILLEDHPDTLFKEFILTGNQSGFRIGFNHHGTLKSSVHNIPSKVPSVISEYLNREVSMVE